MNSKGSILNSFSTSTRTKLFIYSCQVCIQGLWHSHLRMQHIALFQKKSSKYHVCTLYYTYSKPAMKFSQETIQKQPIQHYPSCANFESISKMNLILNFLQVWLACTTYKIFFFVCVCVFETLQLVLITFSLIWTTELLITNQFHNNGQFLCVLQCVCVCLFGDSSPLVLYVIFSS